MLSLRARFQLLLLFGAVLPLVVVGLWLTAATSRAGRTLLRAQLDSAVSALGRTVDERWSTREGELALIAGNDVVVGGLTSGRPPDATAVAYLSELTTALGRQLDASVYDQNGRVWWSPPISDPSQRAQAATDLRSISTSRPVLDASGREIGQIRARVRLSSLLGDDEARHVVPGATLSSVARGDIVPGAQADFEQAVSSPVGPGIRLVLTAPFAPYVRPFAIAARTGLGVLVAVAFLALVLTGFLATRLTRSLEQLAAAATAVAGGDLDREVEAVGAPEIARLASAFNAMTHSLRVTLAVASQQKALAAVGEFAASLSHEVRNALTAIGVDLQHAKRHIDEEHRAAPLVTRTLETVRRLDSTVSGALRLARSGRARIAPVSLRAILGRAQRQAEPAFIASGGALSPLADEADAVVHGDAAALEQLFLNLLINAGQALLPGGNASIHLEHQGSQVVVRICDDGIGIDDETPALVGQSMYTTKADGTGLGLPIARRIAEAHGGRIDIERRPSHGTEVRVTLSALSS